MKRVLISGSRIFDDKKHLYHTLDQFCLDRGFAVPDHEGNWMPNGLTIIHGGAEGADLIADDWAVCNWVPIEEYKISKEDWAKFGRAAGPIRNKQMLDTGIDVVIAFPRGRASGTKHMIKIAKEAGVEVIEA